MAKFSKRSLDNLKCVHPKLVHLLSEAIIDTPVDFTIVEGLRTTQRQQELYAQGRTKAGPKVTNADGVKNLSNHQDEADGVKDGVGQAVDLYPYFDGKVQVNHPQTVAKLKQIAAHIKAKAAKLGYTVVWGGDWKTLRDYPHFEIK